MAQPIHVRRVPRANRPTVTDGHLARQSPTRRDPAQPSRLLRSRLLRPRPLRSPLIGGWLTSRAIVLGALALSQLASRHVQGSLLGWDAAWYRDIAAVGYDRSPEGAERFFPAWPVLARVVAALTSIPAGVVLVVAANVCALGYATLLRRIALTEQFDEDIAQTVVQVAWFAPAAFVLTMGYAEALFGIALCLVLLAARARQWTLCAAAGLLVGALRPTGVLVCVPLIIEAVMVLREHPGRRAAWAAAAAVTAPLAGLGLFLGWTWAHDDDVLAPFREQTAGDLRGGILIDPFRTLVEGLVNLGRGNFDASFLAHLVFIPVALALTVVAWRRLPVSFAAYATVTLFVAVTAAHFGSFERYAEAAVPLLLAAAVFLARRPRLRRAAAIAAPAVMFALAWLAFADAYVP